MTPKRLTDPAFQGVIYIQEDSWRIHSVDMMLTKSAGIEFADSVKIFQVFAPAQHGIWMPLSQKFTYKFRAFGFVGSGVFSGVYSNYKVEPNPSVYQAPLTPIPIAVSPKPTPKKEKAKQKEFGNAVLKVEEGSNEKDSIFWAAVRPVPLTPIEMKDYLLKDSLAVIKASKPYKDSLDLKKNKFKPANLIAAGYTYHWSFKERYLTFPNLTQLLQFNTIEGLVPEISLTFTQNRKRQLVYRINPAIRYGFSNRKFQAQIEGLYMLDRKYDHFLTGGFGRYVYQFNEAKPIPEVANSIQTLYFGNNHMKIFQKTFAFAGYSKEVADGLKLRAKIEYAFREEMANTRSFSFNDDPKFTPNAPINKEWTTTGFGSQTALTTSVRLTYTPGEKYIDRPTEKFSLGSKYPTFELYYKRGIPGIAQTNFDYLEGSVKKTLNFGIYGGTSLHGIVGKFLTTSSMSFVDFHHFSGNQIFIRQLQGDRLFQLLDYYLFSTQKQFLEGHAEHHFNGFVMNKIPFVKKLHWQLVLSGNYLSTPGLRNYTEVGLGIEHIFKFFRIDYYRAYKTQGHTQGFRIGAGF